MIGKLVNKLCREKDEYELKKEEDFDFDFESCDYNLTNVQSVLYELDRFKYKTKKTFAKKNIESSLAKIIMYPILGALPADIRNKLQDTKLVKKYDVNLEDAAASSCFFEIVPSMILIPLVASTFLSGTTLGGVVVGSSFYAFINPIYRSFRQTDRDKIKGSTLTEIPYKIYKSIKKFSDYINDKEVIKNEYR